MNRVYIPYKESIPLIKEADVLLFRPKPRQHWYSLPSVGNLIAKYTGGEYSHVGVASCEYNRIMLVEFREWYGGRSTSLENQFPDKSGLIDVFRVIPKLVIPKITFTEEKYIEIVEEKIFTEEIAYNITNEMYRLTGLPYGWKIIFKLGKAYLPGIRLFADKNKFDNDVQDNIYVCSTAVNYCFRKHYHDPVPGIADSYTKPSDLGQTPLFSYQFTIT